MSIIGLMRYALNMKSCFRLDPIYAALFLRFTPENCGCLPCWGHLSTKARLKLWGGTQLCQ